MTTEATDTDTDKPRKPRTTGKLVWLRCAYDQGALTKHTYAPIDGQPEHADIAAAAKWLSERVATEALPAGETYALHRAVCTVSPRVEVTRKAVLL